MKIILLQPVKNLGNTGEIVDVKPGYAMNYLIPKKLAVKATPIKLREISEKKRLQQERAERDKKKMASLEKKLAGKTIEIKTKANEVGHLFGSIQQKEISDKLKEIGFKVNESKIILKEPIKKIGEYDIEIALTPENIAKIKLIVKGF